jgi:hypothetical protein
MDTGSGKTHIVSECLPLLFIRLPHLSFSYLLVFNIYLILFYATITRSIVTGLKRHFFPLLF